MPLNWVLGISAAVSLALVPFDMTVPAESMPGLVVLGWAARGIAIKRGWQNGEG